MPRSAVYVRRRPMRSRHGCLALLAARAFYAAEGALFDTPQLPMLPQQQRQPSGCAAFAAP